MSAATPAAPEPRDPDQIKAEIDATRAQLARTVDELGARLDVRSRAKERAFRARDTAVETYRESPPAVVAGAVGLAALVLGLVIARRKRAARRPASGATRRRKR
jgi:ElaB/YqjD/DUF883 family membrane-anchored ribosome-binding protein